VIHRPQLPVGIDREIGVAQRGRRPDRGIGRERSLRRQQRNELGVGMPLDQRERRLGQRIERYREGMNLFV
jgi:hypothetical protein